MAWRRGSPEVRAADAQVQDMLYQPQEIRAMEAVARKAKKGVTDPFRSFKKGDGGLGDIFKTPDDILFKGSFDEAACAAESGGKCASGPYILEQWCRGPVQHPGLSPVCARSAAIYFVARRERERAGKHVRKRRAAR